MVAVTPDKASTMTCEPIFLSEAFATPTGEMLVLTDADGALRAVDWRDYEERMHRLLRRQYPGGAPRLAPRPAPSPARQALEAYFTGDLAAIDALDVRTGGTNFQRQVWAALRQIPVKQTTSYGALARRLGRPDAPRAVGLANGANPIAVVVPCHRVVGAGGALTGYGGGIDRKLWLLRHEGANP